MHPTIIAKFIEKTSENSARSREHKLIYSGDLDKRPSTTGYVFTIAGGALSWRSMLETPVTFSTTEAEYMALIEAVKEAIWLNGFLAFSSIL